MFRILQGFHFEQMVNWMSSDEKYNILCIKIHVYVLAHVRKFDILNFPTNYNPTLINSGCCGMAGSFGYEKEHYNVSMKIGGLRLFPSIKKAASSTIIAANGTSCRHQIKDGTQRQALHPITILKNALN